MTNRTQFAMLADDMPPTPAMELNAHRCCGYFRFEFDGLFDRLDQQTTYRPEMALTSFRHALKNITLLSISAKIIGDCFASNRHATYNRLLPPQLSIAAQIPST